MNPHLTAFVKIEEISRWYPLIVFVDKIHGVLSPKSSFKGHSKAFEILLALSAWIVLPANAV